jgi:hypothetical protein
MNLIKGIAVLVVVGLVASADAQLPPGTTFNNAFIPLKIGAGGSISSIDIQCDQGVGACNNSGTTTKVIRTDTYGAYIYDAALPNPGHAGGMGAWRQLMTSSSFPVKANAPYQPVNGGAVYEIRIAPSNTSHLYMMTNGLLYISLNKGMTWTQANLAQTLTNGGDQITETFGPYIAIDPKNENIAIVGTANSGAFYTTNGGNSFTQISGLCTPASPPGSTTGQGGGYIPAFDPSSGGTTSTLGVYLTCWGTGIYHSATGVSGTFSLVGGTGMPTRFTHMDVDNSGIVYTAYTDCGGVNGAFQKFSNGTWQTITTTLGAKQIGMFALDRNSTHMIAGACGSVTSYYNGSRWSAPASPTLTSNDIPWLNHGLVNGTFAGSTMVFDPARSNTLFYAEGIGVAYSNPTTSTTLAWNDISAGIEQLVPRGGVSPPGGNPVIAFMDRPVFTITDPTTFPTDHGLNYTNPRSRLQEGYSVDYASANTSFIVVLAQALMDCCSTTGYSTNGGGDGSPGNWTTPFAGYSAITDFVDNGGLYHGGAITAASSTCVVIAVGNGSIAAARAASGLWQWNGKTWSSPTITGIPNTGNPGWGFSYYLVRQILAADRVDANTVYAYNEGGSGNTTAGIYKTTDCSTWRKVSVKPAGAFPSSGYNATLKAVPGISGNLFFTSGSQSPDDRLQPFWESKDHGANWSAVARVTDVFAFDFGKAKPGESTVALYCYCRVDGTLSVWRGTNNWSTWTQLAPGDGAFPGGTLDFLDVLVADANTYGRVYICFAGSGCKWGAFQ